MKLLPNQYMRYLAAAMVPVFVMALLWSLGVVSDPASKAASSANGVALEADMRGYGFASSLRDLSREQLETKLKAMKQAGATWVRYDLSWNAVQGNRTAGQYDWAGADQVTQVALAQGLDVVMIIDLTPPSERMAGCDSELCPPAHPEAYAAFARAAAEHYRPYGVRAWEIWNEPNISYRFRSATDPARYVAMLKGAYTAIKQVDPQATVIAASTAPSATDADNLTPLDFLKAMYDEGAKGYFDAVSAHPYTYPKTPAQSSPDDAWGQLTAMHEVMVAHGDGTKRIWITEFGAPTNGPDDDEYVSEAVQAQTLTEAVRIFRGYDWAGPLFWYDYQDVGKSTSTSENFYGLVRYDGSHKPAYDAFKSAAGK